MPETPRIYRSRDQQTLTLQFGDGAIQSRMQRDAPGALLLDYTRTMLAALMWHPQPQRIGMVGLGGGSMPRFIHREMPASTLQVMEIEPAVIAMRDDFELPADDARLRVWCADGAAHLADLADLAKGLAQGALPNPAQPATHPGAAPFDVLMIDGFTHEGLPEVLCSQAFYDDCAATLPDDGLLIANLPLADPRCPEIAERLQRSFGQEPLLLDDEDKMGGNCIALASRQPWRRWRSPARLRPPAGMAAEAWVQLSPPRLRLRKVLDDWLAAQSA